MKKVKIFSLSFFALFLMLFSFVIFPVNVYAGGGGGTMPPGGGSGGGDQPSFPTEFVQYKDLTNLKGKITELNEVSGFANINVFKDSEFPESLGIMEFDLEYLFGAKGTNSNQFLLLYQVDYSVMWLPDKDCWVVDFYNPTGMQIWALDQARGEYVSSSLVGENYVVNMYIYIGRDILLSPSTYAVPVDRFTDDVVIDNLTSQSNLLFSAESNKFSIQSNEFSVDGTADEWFSHISQFNNGVARGVISHPAEWDDTRFVILVEEEPSHELDGFDFEYDGRFSGNEDLIYFEPRLHSVLQDWAYDLYYYDFAYHLNNILGQTNYDGYLYWNFEEQYWQIDYYISSDFEPVFDGETAFVTNVDDPMSVEDILSHIRLIDDHDGDVSHTITIISDNYTPNKNTLGTFEIEIEGHDLSDNYAQLTIYVLVKDISEPVISGQSNYQQSYTKKLNIDTIKNGLTVSDNYDSDLQIVLDSDNYSSNYNRLGSYNVVFSATDSSGNKGIFTLNIKVIDDVAPVFSGPTSIMKGKSEILSVDDIKDQLTANDFIDGLVEITVKSDNYTGNGNKVGKYTVVFQAQDSAGNVATHTVEITVSDNIPPIFYVDNYFITVEQSLILTREDIIAILQASGQLNVQSTTNVQFLLNEYEGNETVVGIYAVSVKASSADGSGKIFNLAVQVVEDEGGTVVHPDDPWYKQVGSWFVKAWDWLKKPVKENSWFRWGYIVGFGAVVLVLGVVRAGSSSGRRYRRRW